MPGGFNASTRQKFGNMAAITRPSGGGASPQVTFDRVGLAAGLWLQIRGSISGTLSNLNALGKASIIKRVHVKVNQALDVIDISGAGYHYLLRDHIDSGYIDPVGQSDAKSAVATGNYNLDMYLPFMLNARDPIGLLQLQNEQTQVSLNIEWETDANVATGITAFTGTVTPRLEYFTLPLDERDWPPLNLIHQIQEDQLTVPGSADFPYDWLRGNTYLGIYHGLGIGASGADGFNRVIWRVQQSDTLVDFDTGMLDMLHRKMFGRARPAGVIAFDLLATSGLGEFGLSRDTINSALLTYCRSLITPTGAGTLYTVRRQIQVLQ